MANRAHEPTDKSRAEVEAYAAVGVPHHDIAKLIKIDTKTLLKYYRDELDLGKAKATAQVGRALFKAATSGNTSAQIFWMKAQAGWREKIDVTSDGKGVGLAINIDLGKEQAA